MEISSNFMTANFTLQKPGSQIHGASHSHDYLLATHLRQPNKKGSCISGEKIKIISQLINS
jgi:hypothetical protein